MAKILDPGAPEAIASLEALDRLDSSRRVRVAEAAKHRAYYEGQCGVFNLASRKFADAFRKQLEGLSDSWGTLIVDAVAERLQVDGIRIGGDAAGSRKAWAFWQANHLDADSSLAFTESVAGGSGYALVWPTDSGTPSITFEDADACEVEYVPGSRRDRASALKVWTEPGLICATVYLPNGVFKWQQDSKPARRGSTAKPKWVPRLVPGEAWPLANPMGVVPMVELPNNPTLAGGRSSDLATVIPLIDAATKLLADTMTAAEFGAFRQRWVTGIEIPVDENGDEIEPFQMAIDRLLVASGEGSENAKFGEFSQTELSGYISAIEMVVSHLAAITRLPLHLFLSHNGQVPSGEGLVAAEMGLVTRVRGKQRTLGECLEEVIRLAFLAAGDTKRAARTDLEIVWKDAATYSESAHIDALTKKAALGVPLPVIWAEAGYSPQQIAEWSVPTADTPIAPVGTSTADS